MPKTTLFLFPTILLLLGLFGAAKLQAASVPPELNGRSGWTAVMFGAAKDPQGDSQAGAADTDIVGDEAHGSLYAGFSDNGTASTDDDLVYFRLRIDNPTSPTVFNGVAVVGMDANGDGRIDIFMTVDGRNNGQFVRLMDPGTDANISPSTTSTAPLPAGWLPNNGVYPFTASNYAMTPVSINSDPHWNGNTDVGLDGKSDLFISWAIPVADLATVLAIPSPADRNGNYGPRGPDGIAGYDQNTLVQYVAFTQTQNGPINGDLLGVGASYDKNATFASLGTFTAPMSASAPASDGPSISITTPISGDDVINDAEDDSVTISGTSAFLDGKTLTLTVSDGTTDVIGTATIAAGGAWTVTGLDLSGLNDGTLTVTATAVYDTTDPDVDIEATTTVLHDKTPPAIAIDELATTTAGKPTFTGTSDLADGSIITINIDPDNNPATANLTYQVIVSGGVWTLDTATVAPVAGTMPVAGLTAYAKITATATDAAGNTATATSLNRPTVTAKSTNDTTPVLSGKWTQIAGDVLTVTVSGATYTLSPTGNTWTLDLETATPSSGILTPLMAGNTYSVVATVTRGGDSVDDTTVNELTITNDPVTTITIDGGATATGTDPTPTITGTSQNAGGFVIVRIDPNNDGILTDAVTYSVAPDGSGDWSLDTSDSSKVISGTIPGSGFIGVNGVRATDSTGTVAATQVLTVTLPTITITSITSEATANSFGVISNTVNGDVWLNITEDDKVRISGTATDGYTVDLIAYGPSGNSISTNGLTVTSGDWSTAVDDLNLSSFDNGTLTFIATLSGTSISATNTAVTHDKIAPQIVNTTPSFIVRNQSGVVIKGATDLPVGTNLTVTIYSDAAFSSVLQTYSTSVASGGSWSITTTSSIGNVDPVYIRVSPTSQSTDTAGNIAQPLEWIQATTTGSASVNTISITNITGSLPGDGIITVGEIGSGVTISGSLSLSGSGTVTNIITDGTISITNTTTYSNGSWTNTLSTAQVQSFNNGQLTVTATALDTGPNPDAVISDVVFTILSLASPVLTITDNAPDTATGDVTFTFTFSEDVTGFTLSDITTNGIPASGTLITNSASSYSLVVTPYPDSSGNIVVSVASSAATGVSTGRGNTAASNTQPFNTTAAAAAPTLTIDTSDLATNGFPLITGTNSLPAGSPVVIEIDSDNDGDTDLTYSATVQSDGTWSLDLETATPVSGTLPEAGLDPWAKITATSENAFGNSTSVAGLNTPAVTSQITNDTTPTVTGTWTAIDGDTIEVVLNSVTYSVALGNLTTNATTWSLTVAPADALTLDGAYDVTATVTRGLDSATDLTSSELTLDTAASVAITGGATATTGDSTPLISGTSADIPVGTVLTLELDIDDDGFTDLVYKTTIGVGGAWSVDTTTAIPFSGTFPSAGLSGDVIVTATATDPAGNIATDTQTLTVDVTPPEITITTNATTSDTTPVITGTTDLPVGSTITVTISGATYATTNDSGGNWSVDLETDTPTSGTLTPLTDGNTYTITASGTDSVGNSTTASKPLTIDLSAPIVTITEPIDSVASGGNADGTLNATEDDNVVIQGTTSDVPAGSTLSVTITDGSMTISDTATVAVDGTWSLDPLNLSSMANGVITVTATYFDDFGNSFSDSATVLHDKASPGTVTIDAITLDTGVLSDFITSDPTLVFSGSAGAGETVTLTLTGPSGTFVDQNVTADGSGGWTFDHTGTTLTNGTYTLTAVVTGPVTVNQTIIIDTTAPAGPVTVNSLTTDDTTPTITGTATLGLGENLTVTVNGVTYTVGDGNLTHDPVLNTWSLTIPTSNALTPADISGTGFNGTYNVTATITDTAGNSLSDGASGELTVTDVTAPVIDLDPTAAGAGDGTSLNHSVTSVSGAAVSLDDNSDPATLVEASDKLVSIDITVGGLLNGASEKLIFGSTTVAADGSSGTQSDITVGGVRVNVTYASNVFTLQKFDFTALTETEAQAVIRDLQYQNTAGSITAGTRTFAITTTDDAGNTSASATSSVTVTAVAVANAAASTLTPTSASITANGVSTQVLTVTANDLSGDPIGAGGATVTITKQSGTGTISGVTDVGDGTYTATVTSPTVTGSGVFVATLNGDPVEDGTPGQTQATVTYTAGPPAAITLAGPASVTAGVASGDFTLTVVDAFGNAALVTADTDFALTSTSDGTVTFNPVSPVTVLNGQSSVTFTYTDTEADLQTVTATVQANPNDAGLTGDTATHDITVNAGSASQLAFVQQPTDNSIGVALSPAVTVQVQDAFGNSVAGAGVSIALSLASGTGTLSGTTPQLTDASGLATFSDLSVDTAGAKTLQASSGILNPAVSSSFTIYTATLVAATGGEAISADTAATGGTGVYTALTGPVYSEQFRGQAGVGTIVLNPPSGFEFDTGGTAPTVKIDRQAGTADSALQFDGANDYVEVANSTSLNSYLTSGKLTIEYWIKPGAATGDFRDVIAKRPASNDGGFLVEAGPNSLNYDHFVHTSGGWKWMTVTYTASTWQHIAVVAEEGGTIEVFKNGVSQGTTSLAGVTFTSSSQFLRLMADTRASQFYQNGSMDEVRIWNVARTQAQIQAALKQRLTGSEAGLAAYWRLDDGSGTTAADATANSNTGTLLNGSANDPVADGTANGPIWATSAVRNINAVDSGTSAALTSVTSSALTFTVTSPTADDVINSLTWQNVRVRPTDGTPLASGEITKSGTSSMVAIQDGVTNFGTLGEVPGAIDNYLVSAASPQTAGGTFTTTVTAGDQFNNVVTTDSSTVVTLSSSGNAQFDSNGDGTFGDVTKTLVNGTFTIDTKDDVAETITLTATDGNTKTGTSGNVVINAGAPAAITLAGPASVTAGVASGNFTLTVVDAFGNPTVVSADTDFVLTSTSDGTVTFDPLSPVKVVNGQSSVTFTYTDTEAALQTVTATVQAAPTDAGLTGDTATHDITVNPGAVDHYVVSAASPQTAGGTFTTTVTAQDSFNNVVTTDSSTVVTLSSSGNAQFDSNGDGTFGDVTKTLVNGTFTIDTKDDVAETITLTATDGNTKTGTSGNVVINAGAPAGITLTGPASVTAGQASGDFTLTVVDAFGNATTVGQDTTFNLTSDSTGTVTFDPVSPVTVLDGQSSVTFTYTDTKAGSPTVTATWDSGGADDLGNDTHSITVTHGAATQYVILDPVDGTVDAPITVTVQLQDQFGNVVTSGADKDKDVTLVTDSSATGAGVVDIVNGVGSLAISNEAAETVTLSLTDSAGTGFNVDSIQDVVFAPGVAAALVFTTQPGNAIQNQTFGTQPVVRTVDQFDNFTTDVPPSLNVVLTIAQGVGGATLNGTVTLDIGTAAGNGTVSFTDLAIDTGGEDYQLKASADGLTADFSALFDVITLSTTYETFATVGSGSGGGSGPANVVIGDFNINDAKRDLAVVNYYDDTISILLGHGTGNFTLITNYNVGAGPRGLAIGDFNRDGLQELATANFLGNSVTVLQNKNVSSSERYFVNGLRVDQAMGRVAGEGDYPVGNGPCWIATGDFTGDGRTDLVTANFTDGTVSVLINLGNSRFEPAAPASYAVNADPGNAEPTSVAVADMNKDGKLDLITVNKGANSFSIFLGLGDGTFQSAVEYPFVDGDNNLQDLHPVGLVEYPLDFSGNGFPDLAVTHTNTHSVSVLVNQGGTPPTFARTDYAVGQLPQAVIRRDVNHNGKLDLVVVNSGQNTISLLWGNGDGTFQTPAEVFLTGGYPLHIATGNFDGVNNGADFVVCNAGDGTLSIIMYNTVVALGVVSSTHQNGYIRSSTVNEDEAVELTLLGNLVQGATPVYKITQAPLNGSLKENGATIDSYPALLAGDTISYLPSTNFFGDFYGAGAVTFSVVDGIYESPPVTINIRVLPVNDAPSFTVGADVNWSRGAGPASVSIDNWATDISAGPGESHQTVQFLLRSNDRPDLFKVRPSVTADGTLTFTPQPGADYVGTATIGIELKDNGGTARGGVELSGIQYFEITIAD